MGANTAIGAASELPVADPQDQEVEHLRSILKNAHDPHVPLAKKVFRALKTRLGDRMKKRAIAERIEKPRKEDAA
jgi:hypothetical protein